MVGSWSSGNRWLMNCIVMASKQEMELMTVTIKYFTLQLCTRASNPFGLGYWSLRCFSNFSVKWKRLPTTLPNATSTQHH